MSVKLLEEAIPFESNIQAVMDQIAGILKYELANQQILSPANASDYDIRVFTDRFDPLDQFKTDKTPLINIELSDESTQTNATGPYGKVYESVVINLYIYATGVSRQTAEGHTPADYDASVKVKKLRALILRILKADINSNLQLPRDLVNSVVVQAGQFLVPDFNNRDYSPVIAQRLAIQCTVTTNPAINNGVPLESLVIDIEKDDSGEVFATIEFTNETST